MTTITWLGGTSHFWGDAANWSGAAVPRAGDDVVIPGVLVEVIGGAAADITLDGAGTLEVVAGLAVSGNLSGGTVAIGGTLGAGELDLSAGSTMSGLTLVVGGSDGTIASLAGTVTLAASVLIPQFSGRLEIAGPGVLAYDGSITLAPYASLFVSGTLGGDPTITLSDDAVVQIDAVAGGASPTIDFTGHAQDVVLAGSGIGVTLEGLQGGDRLDLKSLSSTGSTSPAAEIVAGTLEITAASGETASIALADPAAGLSFLVIPDDTNTGSLVEVLPYEALTATTDFDLTGGVDYGTFTLDAATVTVAGSITVEGYYTVDLQGGAAWRMDGLQIGPSSSTGNSGALTLQGASGAGSLIVGGALSLGMVDDNTAQGSLDLAGGINVIVDSLTSSYGRIAFDGASAILVGTGTATAGALTVAAGATMELKETSVTGNVVDDGDIALLPNFGSGLMPNNIGIGGDFTLAATLVVATKDQLGIAGTFLFENHATLNVEGFTSGTSSALAVADGASATILLNGGAVWFTDTLTVGANPVPASATAQDSLVVAGSVELGTIGVSGAILLGQDAGADTGPGAGALTLDAMAVTAASLSLLNSSSISLDAAASLVLGTGTATAGAITIGDGTLSVDVGVIDASVIDDGALHVDAPTGALTIAGDLMVSGILEVGGRLDVAGTLRVAASGTLSSEGTLDVGALSGDGVTIGLGENTTIGGFSGNVLVVAGQTIVLEGTDYTGLTDAALAGSEIDLRNVAFSSSYGEGLSELQIAGADIVATSGGGGPMPAPLIYTRSDGVGGTLVDVSAPCYAAGTRILAENGEVAVESLRPGDTVRTASGRLAPVVWVGWTRVDLARHPHPGRAAPIRIAADAIGPGLPARDLFVSPDHSLLLDGSLVPAWQLANGATIARQDVAAVTYFHVELDRHDILLAEGLAAESFLDTGNRGAFANATGARTLHADFAAAPDEDALRIWAARAAAPLLLGGAGVAALRARFAARAEDLGWHRGDAALAVFADGTKLVRDMVPAGTRTLQLRSRCFVPAETIPGSPDRRRLGVAVAAALLGGWPLPPDAFAGGWHGCAAEDWRWTDGNATLRLPPVARPTRLELRLALPGIFWLPSASHPAANRAAA